MNNGMNNGGNGTGTNGKFDFFPPDNGMNANNQGMQQNNSAGMGANQNMNFNNINAGVDYMNNGNNNQMNGMQNGVAQPGMQQMQQPMQQQNMNQQAMPQMGMNQPNMMQPGMQQPMMQQPMQMGYGNQPGMGVPPKKDKKKFIMTFAFAAVVAIVTMFIVNSKGYDLTCTAEDDSDGRKSTAKIQYKIGKGDKESVVNIEFKYKYDDLEDEEVESLYDSLTIISGDDAEELNLNGTTNIGKSYLGDNTVLKRKGNTITVTAKNSSEVDDDEEDIDEIKESAEENGFTCK